MEYTVNVIIGNSRTSFGYDDFESACNWACTASLEIANADSLVIGNGMTLFMYRNGIKCDLGGTPLTLQKPTVESQLLAAGYGHRRDSMSETDGKHTIFRTDNGKIIGRYDAMGAFELVQP